MRVARAVNGLEHSSTPLVVRASLPRTFWSLGVFAEAGLCFVGIYLLVAVLKSPLEADQAEVIIAGVLLALATILLFYLIGPQRFDALAKPERSRKHEEARLEAPLTAYGEAVQARQRAEKALEEEGLPGPM